MKINNEGYETKEIENQPRLKNFNLKIILTCNICMTGDCINFSPFY